MPRSTKSRRVAEQTAALNPDATTDELRNGNTDVDGERLLVVDTGPEGTEPTEPTEEMIEAAVADAREWTVDALHGRDFDWTTMTWNPPKAGTNGVRPCMCNRVRGHECELTTKSRFSIGHDARFKGVLQTAFRQGKRLVFAFEADDKASVTDADGHVQLLVGELELEADTIARLVAPKLLPHVTHQSRSAQLQKLDAEAGTTVPQTAVMGAKADEDITDADLDAIQDDAAGADEEA